MIMKAILTTILFVLPAVICVQAQQPRQFDEYGKILFSDEKARLDNVALQLRDEPTSVVYLWVYGGRKSCAGEVRARAIRAKNHLVRRGIKAERVIWKEAGYREELTVAVWIFPREASEPSAAPTIDPSEVKVLNCKNRRVVRKANKP